VLPFKVREVIQTTKMGFILDSLTPFGFRVVFLITRKTKASFRSIECGDFML
jgi:hypothetical protein